MSVLTGIVAPPTSREKLRLVAARMRKRLGCTDPWFPIVEVLEGALDDIAPGYCFDVLDVGEMGSDHGLTLIQERMIFIREDVYEGAWGGGGRDRMTIAHEIGHAMLHSGMALGRRMGQEIKPYEDPEWQAKAFAGELLVAYDHLPKCSNAIEVVNMFGVSEDAANQQLRAFRGARTPRK